jgi:signal transduction histidine kinase
MVALTLLACASLLLAQRSSTEEALRDAELSTVLLGSSVIEPELTNGLLEGDEESLNYFDGLMAERVLRSPVVRVRIWDADGRVVYSDVRDLVGEVYELGPEDLEILEGGGVEAEVSDLSKPENRYEQEIGGELLEVYTQVDGPDGSPLLFEAYYQRDEVTSEARRIFVSVLPVVLVPLLALAVVDITLAWRLARRLRAGQLDRERLLRRALESSQAERRRVAADLHDGVVQDLAGVSYRMAALADAAKADGNDQLARQLEGAAADARRSVRGVRSLLVEIYPPSLREAGLKPALSDLLDGAAARGLETHLEVPDEVALDPDQEMLVYRVAQESVRNVVSHAAATSVRVTLSVSADLTVLTVEDDGMGFDSTAPPAEEPGHLGLRLLADLAADAGAQLDVASTPGSGTVVRLEVAG